jgi:hypothetical protein
MKLITRQQTFDMYEANWCPQCGKVVKMIKKRTGMPGIATCKCTECDGNICVNFTEDAEDVLKIPDHLKIMGI